MIKNNKMFLLLGFIFILLSTKPTSGEIENSKNKIQKRKETSKIEKQLLDNIKKYKGNPYFLNKLGKFYHNQGKYKKAIFYLKKSIKEKDFPASSLYLLARSYKMCHMYKKSTKYYIKFNKLYPEDEAALSSIVSNLKNQKKYKEALKYSDLYLKLYPNDKSGVYVRGIIQLKTGLYKEAEKTLKKAIMLDRKKYKIRFTLGITYLMEEKFKKAKLQYKLLKRKDIIRSAVLKEAIDFFEKKKNSLKKCSNETKYNYLKEIINEY